MPKRGPRELVLNQDGGYWIRSKNQASERRRPSTRSSPPRRDDVNTIIVEDAEHGRTVYHAPSTSARPQARRERSYSDSQLPLRRPDRDHPKRRHEAVIVERASSPARRRRDPSPENSRSRSRSRSRSSSSSSSSSTPPPRRRREKSPRRARRASSNKATVTERKPRRRSEAPPPPSPPPYQPFAYAQAAPAPAPAPAQAYYGQPFMEPARQGNAATRFGRKLGNAAIFGAGFTGGADLVNSIL